MSADFNWSKDREHVIVLEQRCTAIYRNPEGGIVIRQERGELEEDDAWVVIAPIHVPAVIDALIALAEQAEAIGQFAHHEKPRDATAALRQRRRRERKRHGDNVVTLPQAAE